MEQVKYFTRVYSNSLHIENIKRENKVFPFLSKFASQWSDSYWYANWHKILQRLPPLRDQIEKPSVWGARWIKVDLLHKAEAWIRKKSSGNSSWDYGHCKYMFNSYWGDLYCKDNGINRTAFMLQEQGVDVQNIMNDTADWV